MAYLKGDVANWDRIVATTLALKDQEYPYGWRVQGEMNDHNAYDVVRIFQLGWTHMDEPQRAEAAEAIAGLLDWSLSQSLQADGAFKASAGFASSVSDAQYHGVSLLTRTGFCSTGPSFWTDRVWPEAKQTCCRIAGRLAKFSMQVPAAQVVRRRLAQSFPLCPADAAAPVASDARPTP